MSITPILLIIIPVQLVLLVIVIWLSLKIKRNNVNVEIIKGVITLADIRIDLDKTNVIRKIIAVIKSNEAKGKTVNYEDLSDLIYNELTKNDSFIKSLINSEVILGLSGTFFGLILALSNINPATISETLTAGDFINVLIQQMDPFLKGLSLAFGASFAGVVCMLIGNLFYTYANRKREINISELLFIINSELLPSIASVNPEEKIYQSVNHFSEKVEELTGKIRESLFDFNSHFELLIKKTTDSFNTTLDKIIDENKIALNTQINSLQSSANDLLEIKNNIVTTISTISKSSEKQVEEISNLHRRIESGNKQFLDDLRIYIDSQSNLIKMFDDTGIKQSELFNQYSEHFGKLQQLGGNINELAQKFSENLSQLTLLNKQFPEFLNGLETNTTLIKTTVDSFDSIVERFDKNVQSNVANYFKVVEDVIKELDSHFGRIQKEYQRIDSNIDAFTNSQAFTSELINSFKESVELTLTPIKEFNQAGQEVRRLFDTFEEKFLEKQNELFKKVTEQSSIPVNIHIPRDGGSRYAEESVIPFKRKRKKVLRKQQEKVDIEEKADTKPLGRFTRFIKNLIGFKKY